MAVAAMAVAWVVVPLAAPDLHHWLLEAGDGVGEEAPIEVLEHALLCGSGLLWLSIAWRSRGRGPALLIGVLMLLQIGVLLGEELDWGVVLGLRYPGHARNLRMILREHGLIPYWADAPAVSAFLLLFLLTPLSARLRALWRRAAPVAARPAEGVALLATLPCWLLVWALLGDAPPPALPQSSAYLLLAVLSLRIFSATGQRSFNSDHHGPSSAAK